MLINERKLSSIISEAIRKRLNEGYSETIVGIAKFNPYEFLEGNVGEDVIEALSDYIGDDYDVEVEWDRHTDSGTYDVPGYTKDGSYEVVGDGGLEDDMEAMPEELSEAAMAIREAYAMFVQRIENGEIEADETGSYEYEAPDYGDY